jgi:cysteine-rich repeat protein
MGASATEGSGPQSVNVSEAFDVPAQCTPDCGDSLLQAGEQCDDGGAAAFDGCSAGCRAETLLAIYGVAMGGSVSVTVDDVLVTVPTSAGQNAAQVAAALAAAIQANGTLAAAGVTAAAMGGQLAVGGDVTTFVLADSGLLHAPIPVPSLSPTGRLLAAAVLALLAACVRGRASIATGVAGR